jgi:hypothetical protein
VADHAEAGTITEPCIRERDQVILPSPERRQQTGTCLLEVGSFPNLPSDSEDAPTGLRAGCHSGQDEPPD